MRCSEDRKPTRRIRLATAGAERLPGGDTPSPLPDQPTRDHRMLSDHPRSIGPTQAPIQDRHPLVGNFFFINSEQRRRQFTYAWDLLKPQNDIVRQQTLGHTRIAFRRRRIQQTLSHDHEGPE
jgi:hypothetical protein